MGNTPSTEPLLAGRPTAEEIAIVDEALTVYETATRYAAMLETTGPDRDAGLARARTAARLLERLANNAAEPNRGTWPETCPTCGAPWQIKSRTMGKAHGQPHSGRCVNGHTWNE